MSRVQDDIQKQVPRSDTTKKKGPGLDTARIKVPAVDTAKTAADATHKVSVIQKIDDGTKQVEKTINTVDRAVRVLRRLRF